VKISKIISHKVTRKIAHRKVCRRRRMNKNPAADKRCDGMSVVDEL